MSSEVESGQEIKRPSVFLSYSRADQEQAQVLAQALEEAGLQVWWDRLIEGGAAFARSIEAALAASDAVIVLWSRHSVASDWVLDEAAGGRDLKKLVPVSLDGTEPPLGFRQYQSIALDARHGTFDGESVQAVLRAVLPFAGRDAIPRPTPRPHTPARRPASRRALLIGGGAVAISAVATGLMGWRRGWFAGSAVLESSVAVLPFKNLSGDAQQVYFSDGLSEEVRATLARNRNLKVMAEASSGMFRDSDKGAVKIASQLGVAFLLDGSVRWSGSNVRVAADLIDGQTGFSRWTETFERKIDDVFAVQSEIAGRVASALAAQVEPGSAAEQREASGGTAVFAAHDAYLRGRALWDQSTDEASEREGLALFDAAIALDPAYAAAHSSRSLALTSLANQFGSVSEHNATYDDAVAAAERAIELAPNFASAYSTLGFVLFQGRLDARAAREPFEKSSVLGAGEANVQARWAQYCARCGRLREASEAMQRALSRDRLNALIHRAAGTVEYAARRFDAAIPPFRKSLEMNPRMGRSHASIGDALLHRGDLVRARVEYLAEPVMDFQLTGLAILEHLSGNASQAQAAMKRLVDERGDTVLYQQAQVLAQFGDLETAVTRLLQAHTAGDSGLIYARNDPFLDPLRSDSRLQALLARMGFEV